MALNNFHSCRLDTVGMGDGEIWLIGRRGKTIEALGVSEDMKNNRERGEGIN